MKLTLGNGFIIRSTHCCYSPSLHLDGAIGAIQEKNCLIITKAFLNSRAENLTQDEEVPMLRERLREKEGRFRACT